MEKKLFNKKTITIILAVIIVTAAVLAVIFLIKDGQKPESGGGRAESSDIQGSESEKNSGGVTNPASSDGKNEDPSNGKSEDPSDGESEDPSDGESENPSNSDINSEYPDVGEILPYETLGESEDETVKDTETETENKTGATDGSKPTDSTEGETEMTLPDPLQGFNKPIDLPMVSFGDD